jgi:hypothetical protein
MTAGQNTINQLHSFRALLTVDSIGGDILRNGMIMLHVGGRDF